MVQVFNGVCDTEFISLYEVEWTSGTLWLVVWCSDDSNFTAFPDEDDVYFDFDFDLD